MKQDVKFIAACDPASENGDSDSSALVKVTEGKIEYIIAIADQPDANGNIYTKDCLKNMVENYNLKQNNHE